MAARAIFIVSLDVAPDKEEEFNHWYDTKHVPEVLRAPGFISGTRYRASGSGKPKYWAVFEAESEEALKGALSSPEFKAAGEDFQKNWGAFVTNFSGVRAARITP